MPLELRPETEAYRLCQPMHVLSFGGGRWDWKRLCWLPSPLWDGGPETSTATDEICCDEKLEMLVIM